METWEAARHFAQEFPRLQVDQCVGVVSAPLNAANFKPDVVVIYCDSAQLSLLLLAREYKDGYNLKCALSGHAACVYGVIPAIQTGECQVAIPCRGDRISAMAADSELIFTVPREKLEELIAGLRYLERNGSKVPRGYRVRPEYPMPESYAKLAQIMGYLRAE